jgi:hypothetical protein
MAFAVSKQEGGMAQSVMRSAAPSHLEAMTMDDPRSESTAPLRLRYAAPLHISGVLLGSGALLVALGLQGSGGAAALGLGAGCAALSSGLLLAVLGLAARHELQVDPETLVLPGLLWGERRVPLSKMEGVSLEPPEDPRRLRVLVGDDSFVVRASCLQGGERSLRALAIAVVRGSRALRRPRPSLPPLTGPAGATPRPG